MHHDDRLDDLIIHNFISRTNPRRIDVWFRYHIATIGDVMAHSQHSIDIKTIRKSIPEINLSRAMNGSLQTNVSHYWKV